MVLLLEYAAALELEFVAFGGRGRAKGLGGPVALADSRVEGDGGGRIIPGWELCGSDPFGWLVGIPVSPD